MIAFGSSIVTPFNGQPGITRDEADHLHSVFGAGDIYRLAVDLDASWIGGHFDFSLVVQAAQTIKAAGGRLYVNPQWLPAAGSFGQPTYRSYERGCARLKLPVDPVIGPQLDGYASERPWCSSPAHVDPLFVWSVMAELRAAFAAAGIDVDYWGVWNEPGGAYYYPPITIDGANVAGGPDTIRKWFIPEIVEPANMRAGPEADGADVLRRCAEAYSYEILTLHPYGLDRGFPDGSLWKLDNEWWPTIRRLGVSVPVWYSEIHDEGAGPDAWFRWLREVTSAKRLAEQQVSAIIHCSSDWWLSASQAMLSEMRALVEDVNGGTVPISPPSRRRAAGGK